MKIARLLVIALIFCVSFSSHSAPASETSLNKLFELTQMSQFLDTAYSRMDNMFAQQFAGQTISEDQRQIIGKYLLQISGMVRKELAWELIKPAIMEIYAATYSEQEVQELNKFYESTLGQKVLKQSPILMNETRQIMQTSMKTLEPKLQALQEKLKQELSTLPTQ